MSGLSAIALSSRRLPMKHHGQTTSEMTSIRTGCWLGMAKTPFGGSLGCQLFGCNHTAAYDPHHQRVEGVAGLERCERHADRGRLPALGREDHAFQRACDTPCDDVSVTQVGLCKGDQDGSFFIACGKVDVADKARHQPGRVERGVFAEFLVEGKACDGQRYA